jgi:hypothetical protein
VCDSKGFLWNVCVRQCKGIHDIVQFVWSRFYIQLRRQDLLYKPVLKIDKIEVWPYLFRDFAYLNSLYIMKNLKASVMDPLSNNEMFF